MSIVRQKNQPALRKSEPKTQNESARVRCSQALLLAALAGGVTIIVLATHWPVLSAQATSADDAQFVTENALVQKPSWASARRFLGEVLEPSTVQGYYLPLSMISLMLDYAQGGRPDDLRPFHRTSLALHALNTVLIILLVYLLFGEPWAAAVVGLVFGVHPLTVEPVAWVGERKTVLAAFFALSCLVVYVLYVRRGSKWLFGACLTAYLLAVMSKPTSTPLPLLMILLDVWPLRRLTGRSLLEKTPFLAIATASTLISLISHARTATVTLAGEQNITHIPLMVGYLIAFYCGKIVHPSSLSSVYQMPAPMALSNPTVLAGVIVTCTLLGVLLVSIRWTRAWIIGGLMFFVALFPTLGIVKYSWVAASDKYVYLPAIGLVFPFAYSVGRAWTCAVQRPRLKRRIRAGMLLLVGVLVGLEVEGVRGYLRVWQNTETLLQHMLRIAPQSDHLHYARGLELCRRGRVDEGIGEYTEALRLNPSDAQVMNALGVALARQGKTTDAADLFARSLRLIPDFADAQTNLGNCLLDSGKAQDAVAHYRHALRIRRDDPVAHYNLGRALMKLGELDEAIAEYSEAVRLSRDYVEAYLELSTALVAQGRIAEATQYLNRVLQLSPGSLVALNNLAWILATRDVPGPTDAARAVELAEKASEMADHPEATALDTLAAAYAAAGSFAEAVQRARTAIALAEASGQSDLAAAIRSRLALYESGRRYIEPSLSTRPSADAAGYKSGEYGLVMRGSREYDADANREC